jgi:hypothetical protein
MPEMTGKVMPLQMERPGPYRFIIQTGMAGRWELVIGAKVQGDPKVVHTAITFDAGPYHLAVSPPGGALVV